MQGCTQILSPQSGNDILREKGCLQSTVYSPKMIDYYLDVIIYI